MDRMGKREVADVQFSCLSNQMKYRILFMMQKYELKVDECKQKMKSRLTDAKAMHNLKKESKYNKEQLQKYQLRYDNEI
jgi:hypothetical protein